MKVHFLGSGAGNFRGSRRQPSSALVDTLLLDCGAGATGRLYDLDALGKVHAVLISHLHSDHVAGIFDFLLHTVITHRSLPLVVVGPPGIKGLLQAGFAVHETVLPPGELYPFEVIEGEELQLTVGPWTVRSVPLSHSVVNLGYHAARDGLSLFYTGDTREPSAAERVRADYLVHEATYAERSRALAQEFGHSTAAQAAGVAAKVGARHLFLNHIGSQPDAELEIPQEAKQAFPDTTVVEDRSSYDL